MKYYYRVIFGHGKEEYVSISQDELPKAIRAIASGQSAIFESGIVNGKMIMAIKEDVQRMMGWNSTYELTGEDVAEAKSMIEGARNFQAKLLGQSEEKKEHEMPKELSGELKKLYNSKSQSK